MGSIIASGEDFHVTGMRVIVQRDRDQARRVLNWAAFRSVQLVGPLAGSLELAHVFKVFRDHPCSYNTVFVDEDTRTEVLSILQPLQEEYRTKLRQAMDQEEKSGKHKDLAPPELRRKLASEVYSEIEKSAAFQSAHSRITSLCFWEQGSYRCTLELDLESMHKSKRVASHSWKLTLTASDFENQRLNCKKTLEDNLEQVERTPQYLTSLPTYEKLLDLAPQSK
jgi:hypothetical protein